MKKKLKVLAIDDHPVVLEGYHFMFQNLEQEFEELNFVKAYDCKSAYDTISNIAADGFDLALVDYSIPAFPEEQLHSGKDLALLIRQSYPNCKIIMMTMHNELDIVFSIFNSINPEGFINKSDCTTDELMYGFKEVLNGQTFYSKAIKNYSKLIQKGMVLEEIDVRIMRFMARGVKDRNLSSYIPLSYSEIERRKDNIKSILGVNGNDDELITQARNQGYIE